MMPPTISKQTANGPAAKPKQLQLFDRIQALQDMAETGLKFNLYGRSKSGKTRFACTFPKPLLLMGTEDGTKSVKNIPGVDFIKLTTGDDLDVLTKLVRDGTGSRWKAKGEQLVQVKMGEGDPYLSAVLDHGSGYQAIILREVLNLERLPIQMTWGQAAQADWLATAAQFKERVQKLLDLADQQGTHVVIVAHEKNFQEEKPDPSMLAPTIASDLSPTIARWANGAVDYIANTFIKDEEVPKRFTQGVGAQAKTITKMVKTGKKSYCLRIGPHDNYITGFRHVPGIELPDFVVNPTFDKIIALINGEQDAAE